MDPAIAIHHRPSETTPGRESDEKFPYTLEFVEAFVGIVWIPYLILAYHCVNAVLAAESHIVGVSVWMVLNELTVLPYETFKKLKLEDPWPRQVIRGAGLYPLSSLLISQVAVALVRPFTTLYLIANIEGLYRSLSITGWIWIVANYAVYSGQLLVRKYWPAKEDAAKTDTTTDKKATDGTNGHVLQWSAAPLILVAAWMLMTAYVVTLSLKNTGMDRLAILAIYGDVTSEIGRYLKKYGTSAILERADRILPFLSDISRSSRIMFFFNVWTWWVRRSMAFYVIIRIGNLTPNISVHLRNGTLKAAFGEKIQSVKKIVSSSSRKRQ